MTKKKKKIEENSKVDANCDHLVVTEESFNQSDIEKMIITIRGMQVMIDRDLARVYKVTTSQLNQQVKRNIARFPANFRFQLSSEEMNNLKSQFVTSSWGGTRKLPYVFTEPGIAQLSSVLHSEKAIETSVKIMSAFVAMRHFMIQNAGVLMRLAHLERHQIETDEKIDLILDKMQERSPKLLPEQIFQTGCVWDAWAYVSELVRSAKERIDVIDNFVDDRVLSLLMKRGKDVSATIHSRFTKDFLTDLEKHNKQYDEVKFVQLPHKNHDRFLIIDDVVYLLGASVKDMGNGLCAVTKLTVTPETVLGLLK